LRFVIGQLLDRCNPVAKFLQSSSGASADVDKEGEQRETEFLFLVAKLLCPLRADLAFAAANSRFKNPGALSQNQKCDGLGEYFPGGGTDF
jgi:hypothetical protein